MMLQSWRIVQTPLASNAFDGEGARLYGGRWNEKGTPIVYTAATASLAILEMLVHLNSSEQLPGFSCIAVEFDEALVREYLPTSSPPDWQNEPAPFSTQRLGSNWCAGRKTAILAVPSVIVPWEKNYLINPLHPDFDRVKIHSPRPLPLDDRLVS